MPQCSHQDQHCHRSLLQSHVKCTIRSPLVFVFWLTASASSFPAGDKAAPFLVQLPALPIAILPPSILSLSLAHLQANLFSPKYCIRRRRSAACDSFVKHEPASHDERARNAHSCLDRCRTVAPPTQKTSYQELLILVRDS